MLPAVQRLHQSQTLPVRYLLSTHNHNRLFNLINQQRNEIGGILSISGSRCKDEEELLSVAGYTIILMTIELWARKQKQYYLYAIKYRSQFGRQLEDQYIGRKIQVCGDSVTLLQHNILFERRLMTRVVHGKFPSEIFRKFPRNFRKFPSTISTVLKNGNLYKPFWPFFSKFQQFFQNFYHFFEMLTIFFKILDIFSKFWSFFTKFQPFFLKF